MLPDTDPIGVIMLLNEEVTVEVVGIETDAVIERTLHHLLPEVYKLNVNVKKAASIRPNKELSRTG